MLRVPEEVAERQRADLKADAARRHQPVRARALELASWTILLTDAPAKQLSLPEALVLLRERWQIPRIAQRAATSSQAVSRYRSLKRTNPTGLNKEGQV